MKFNQRFDLKVNLEEARQRFVNRAHTTIFSGDYLRLPDRLRYHIRQEIIFALGDKYEVNRSLDNQIGYDFYRNLQALETYFAACESRNKVELLIARILSESEVDLGIKWVEGKFLRSGAELLDQGLVNDPLHWLRKNNWSTVITPFEKGINHFLHAMKRPELYSDVITDMYEALEALAKIVTGRDKDLSQNRELFLSKVNASDDYKKLLADYIDYANRLFRHALNEGVSKPESSSETESFIYLTGLFIRLAIPLDPPVRVDQ